MAVNEYTIVNNRYILHEVIGQGTMGIVHRAYDRLANKDVAVKRIRISVDRLDMGSSSHTSESHKNNLLALTREFRTLASLRHPNIISVLNYGLEAGQRPFFVMDYLPEARNLLLASKKQTFTSKITLLTKLLQALDYLHRHGILHRDLKIDNVLVSERQVHVLDFGLSVKRGQAQGRTGTLAYMAPETIKHGHSVEASDLYSVGVMAYEIFSDSLPYSPNDVVSILSDAPDLDRLNVPPAVRNIIGKLLHKAPEDRYDSAEAVIYALQRAVNHSPIAQITTKPNKVHHFHTHFVGRKTELDLLLGATHRLKQGQGSVYIIGGDRGMGKTRLLEELRTFALVDDIQVLSAIATPDSTLPYEIWRKIIPEMATLTEFSAQETSILGEIAPDLVTITEHPIIPSPEAGGDAAQHRLIATFTTVMRRINRPTILLIDDIHWLQESMTILEHATRLTHDQPLAIIATINPEIKPELAKIIPYAEHMMLPPLDTTDVRLLGQRLLNKEANHNHLLETLTQETYGNPLLIIQMIHAFLYGDEAPIRKTTQDIPINQTIRRIVDAQIQQIPKHLLDVLKFAVAAGTMVDRNLLRSKFSDVKVNEWIMIASDLGILRVRQNEHLMFTQELIRQTILEQLSLEERQSVYTNLALTSERIHAHNPTYSLVLSEYWYQAGDAENTLHYGKIAAQYCFDLGLLKPAFDSVKRALAVVSDDVAWETRAELNLLRGEVLTRLGEYEDALTTYRTIIAQAESVNDIEIQATAYTRMAWIILRHGHIDDAMAIGLKALELAQKSGNQHVTTISLKNLGIIHNNAAQYDDAEKYLSQALEIAKTLDNRREIAGIFNALGLVHLIQGYYLTASDYFGESLKYFELLDDRWNMAVALHNQGCCLNNLGDNDGAELKFLRSLEIDKSINDSLGMAYHLIYLVYLALYREHYNEANRRLSEIEKILKETQDQRLRGFFLRLKGWMYLYLEDYDKSWDYFEQMLAISKETGHQPTILVSSIAFGSIRLMQERWEESHAIFSRYLQQAIKMRDGWTTTEIHNGIALSAYHLGEHSRAEYHVKQGVILAERMGAIPLLLEALAVYAIIHTDDPIMSMSYCQYIMKHPSARTLKRRLTQKQIDKLEVALTLEEQDEALYRAYDFDLDAFVETILADIDPQDMPH